MKRFSFTVLFFLIWLMSFGQNYENPVGWNTSNQYCINNSAGVSVRKSADIATNEGTYSVRLESKNAALLGKIIPGLITTGKLEGGVHVSGGQPYNGRPQKLTGLYKYSPVGNDLASVKVLLSKWNSSTQKKDTIAYGNIFIEKSEQYTSFEVKLEYRNTTLIPDSQLIVIASSENTTNAIAGSVLFVDNLSFKDEFSSIRTVHDDLKELCVYPNPASDFINVAVRQEAKINILSIASGQIVYKLNLKENSVHKIGIGDFIPGQYLIEVKNDKYTAVRKVLIK